MNRQATFAIGLILFVSVNFCLTQTVQRTTYTVGVRKNGDRLLNTKSENIHYNTRQNAVKTLTYSTGGPKLTQVFFDIETDSNQKVTGEVVSGGEGKRDIEVKIRANDITTFKYTVFVYGNSAALMPSLGLIASFIVFIIFVNKQ